jgi:hypothetical protein
MAADIHACIGEHPKMVWRDHVRFSDALRNDKKGGRQITSTQLGQHPGEIGRVSIVKGEANLRSVVRNEVQQVRKLRMAKPEPSFTRFHDLRSGSDAVKAENHRLFF